MLRTMLNTFSCALIMVCVLALPVLGETKEEEALSVTRDKDKTVYTIGGSKQEEDPDKEQGMGDAQGYQHMDEGKRWKRAEYWSLTTKRAS